MVSPSAYGPAGQTDPQSPSAYGPAGYLGVWFREEIFLTSIHLVMESPTKSQDSVLVKCTGCRTGPPGAGPGSTLRCDLGPVTNFYAYFPPL